MTHVPCTHLPPKHHFLLPCLYWNSLWQILVKCQKSSDSPAALKCHSCVSFFRLLLGQTDRGTDSCQTKGHHKGHRKNKGTCHTNFQCSLEEGPCPAPYTKGHKANQLWSPAGTGISPPLSAAEPRAGTAHCLLSTGHSNVRNVTHPGVRTQDPARTQQPAGEDRECFWHGHRYSLLISPKEQSTGRARARQCQPVPIHGARQGQQVSLCVTQLAGLMCTRGFTAERVGNSWTSP